MSNMIQPGYGTRTYSAPTETREARQTGTQGSGFMDMAARAGEKKNDVFEVNGTETTQQKAELSKTEEMQLFKKEFYQDLSKIVGHPTVSNSAVNISDTAFQAMKDDPEYRSQVLSLLQRDLGASYAPRNCSVLITVGTSLDQYRADSWPVGNDSEFRLHSKDSFYKRTSESRDRQKELLEKYQEKKLQAKWRQQRLLDKAAQERHRLAQIGAQEKSFSSIADLLKTRIASTPSATLEMPLPAETDVPFFNL
jgi:hypothetical protein